MDEDKITEMQNAYVDSFSKAGVTPKATDLDLFLAELIEANRRFTKVTDKLEKVDYKLRYVPTSENPKEEVSEDSTGLLHRYSYEINYLAQSINRLDYLVESLQNKI